MGRGSLLLLLTATLLAGCASERVLPARDATLVGDGWSLVGRAEATDDGTSWVGLDVVPAGATAETTGVRFNLQPDTERQQWVLLPPETAGRGLLVTASAPPAEAFRAPVSLRLELVSPAGRRSLPTLHLPVWGLLPGAVFAQPVADTAH